MAHFDPRAMLSFDLETTSADPTEARIVTSALVRIDGAGAHPSEALADPGVEIPESAQKVHGISTEYAREHGRPHDAVLADTIAAIRAGWADGLTLIVFNATYDLTVLRHLEPGFTVTGTVFDPYVIDRIKDPYRKGRRTLGDLCTHYGVRIDNAHEATSDALAAARIAWKQCRVWPELAEMPVEELMEVQTVGFFDMQTGLKEYFEKKGRDASGVATSWPMHG